MVDIVVKYCAGQQNSYVQRVKNITGIHQWLNTDLIAITAAPLYQQSVLEKVNGIQHHLEYHPE